MKFKVKTDDLRNAVAELNTIIVPATTYRAISFILIKASKSDGLILQATDYEINLKKRVEADVVEEGAIGIPGKFLNAALKDFDEEELEVEQTGSESLKVNAGLKKVTFACLSEDEYPVFPKFEEKDSFIISAQLLKENIRKTAYAVSRDTSNMVLMGALWEISTDDSLFNMVSTDTHRLVVNKSKVEFQKPPAQNLKLIVPEKLLSFLVSSLPQTDVPVSVVLPEGDGKIAFNYENTEIVGKLIVGTYPDYESIIPDTSSMKTIVLDRIAVLKAIRFVSVLAEKKSYNVNLSFEKDVLMVNTDLTEVGEAQQAVELEDNKESIKIIFNINYLKEVLMNLDEEKIEFNFIDQRAPVLTKPLDSNEYFTIIMPIRPIE
ncbi:DNA polymerase III subunit beta [bacterium]|nr:DNA polymerase III subunit beta [bacterium]